MSEKWWLWLLVIPVALELMAWRAVFRRAIAYPAGRWATGVAGLAFAVSLSGAWLIDQAKAGVHPERLVPAQIMLAVGMLVALMFGSAALLMAPRPTVGDSRGNPHIGA